jgi:hypothetical protein
MRLLDEISITANASLHRRLYRKVYLANRACKCSYCPMHARENAGPHRYKRKKKEYQLPASKRRDRSW